MRTLYPAAWRTLILYLFLLYAGIGAQAQVPAMQFKRLTVDDGLSNNNVLSLVQDQRGYIWIGTNDGLNRYDGYGFTTFRHDVRDTTSLSNNTVFALLLDHADRLWVGTNDGLNLYDPATGTFTKFYIQGTDEAGASAQSITALFEDRSHRLWIGTTGGLFLFDREHHRFIRYDYEATAATDFRGDLYRLNYVTAIYEDRMDRLWVGTAASLNLLNPALRTYSRFEFEAGSDIVDEVRDISEDDAGRLWIATMRDGLYQVDVMRRVYTRFRHRAGDAHSLPSNSVRTVHQAAQGLIVGTSDGIGLYDEERQAFAHSTTIYGDATSLSFPSVRCILEDDEGNLWIGTWQGLNYVDRHSNHFVHVRRNPESPHGLSDNIVSSFAEDPRGDVWVGTELGGLNHLDSAMHPVQVFRHQPSAPASLSVDNVKALLIDGRGALWIGTHDGGLSRFDRASKQFTHYQYDPRDSTSISGNRVYAIYEDRLGELWVGTNKNGLNRFDRASGRFVRYVVDGSATSISSNEVNVIYEDRVGNLWVGTSRGLNLFDRRSGEFTHFLPVRDDPGSLIDPNVRTLYEDSRGDLWVGTAGGLELFDRRSGTFTHFTVQEGLPNDAINCILEDDEGALWISTNQGLSRFDPRAGTFRNFDVTDGLQSSQFNMNACMATGDGRMFFGGINGFSLFHPANITTNPLAPPVYITGFKLFNRPVQAGAEGSPLERDISETEAITLRHDQNVITLDFVALNYTVPSRNRYAYVLEGFEQNWNYVGAQRTATYTNLPPGQYTFRVRAANNDGIWNEAGTALQIQVLLPWWRTWWAYLAYVLLLAAVLYTVYRYSVNVIRLKNSLALEQVRRKSEDDLHAAKMQFFTNISHEFRTPLTLILGPLQEMIETRKQASRDREELLLIRRNAERLLRLVNQLMDFRKLETDHMRLEVARTDLVAFVRELALSFDEYARHAGVTFTLQSDYEGIYAWVDRDKLETVILNLLSNAFKFTPEGGEVSVEIQVSGPAPQGEAPADASEGGQVHIVVRDTGVGMSEEELSHLFERFYQACPQRSQQAGTGIGLSLSKGIVELHGGTLHAGSREAQGSTFTVTLPLGKAPLRQAQAMREDLRNEDLEPSPRTRQAALMNVEELATPPETDDAPPRDAPLVLVIDDNQDMRTYVRSCLAAQYQIHEAADGVEGFRVAVDTFPDLIICDVMMPEMDGMTLCHKLKEDLRTSHIPIVLLTARTSTVDQLEGLETGADAYVTKPFDSQLLRARAQNLITTRQKLRERFSLDIPIRPPEGSRNTHDDRFLQNVIDLIEERLSDADLTVEALSQEVGMSRVYLHKKLKALTDHTPSSLIRTIRLKHAARLLLEGALTVSEVAYKVGFNTPSHFASSFKKQYGQSPTDYVASFTAQRTEMTDK